MHAEGRLIRGGRRGQLRSLSYAVSVVKPTDDGWHNDISHLRCTSSQWHHRPTSRTLDKSRKHAGHAAVTAHESSPQRYSVQCHPCSESKGFKGWCRQSRKSTRSTKSTVVVNNVINVIYNFEKKTGYLRLFMLRRLFTFFRKKLIFWNYF